MAGAQDTIYLCNFRVSVDGEWLCLKELQDVEFSLHDSIQRSPSPPLALSGINHHHHHHHHHNDHHRQQQLPEQRELRDIMPSSPPPLQHVSSLCLYSMFLHYSLHFTSSSIIFFLKQRFIIAPVCVYIDTDEFWSFDRSIFFFWLWLVSFRTRSSFFLFRGKFIPARLFIVINKMWGLIQIKFNNF